MGRGAFHAIKDLTIRHRFAVFSALVSVVPEAAVTVNVDPDGESVLPRSGVATADTFADGADLATASRQLL